MRLGYLSVQRSQGRTDWEATKLKFYHSEVANWTWWQRNSPY